jgi:hypothetical protein
LTNNRVDIVKVLIKSSDLLSFAGRVAQPRVELGAVDASEEPVHFSGQGGRLEWAHVRQETCRDALRPADGAIPGPKVAELESILRNQFRPKFMDKIYKLIKGYY